MSLPVAILLVAAGFGLLAGGGEVLVRGAVAASRLLRVSPAVIGLTVVAMATSLPELAVSLAASLRGSPDVALGNIVGSNIFNLAGILGLSCIFFPTGKARGGMFRFDVLVMMLAAVLSVFAMQAGSIDRWHGALFLALLASFLAYRTSRARRPDRAQEGEHLQEIHEPSVQRAPGAILLVLGGAALLTFGADVLVRGAVRIAEIAGVSERVIALTLVSVGTGLPELATAVVAGLRGHPAVAVGNVIGSNIFNVFGILGTVSLVRPVAVAPQIASRDAVWMLAFCIVAVLPAAGNRRSVMRIGGVVALGAYVVYLTTLL